MLHQVLDNGVEVVLKENHFAKMIAIQCWVGVGSMHETDEQAGLSHLIEHMLFKGTKKRAVGEISRTVETSGGDMNAYTTFDRTVYYLTLSSQHAELGVDLLADAVLNSTFDPEELNREKEVVIEEIRRGNDNPASKVGRKIFEGVYANSPIARPIIGFENQVAAYTREDVVSYYERWYRPENLTVVAVGDFNSEEMFAAINKYFGVIGKPMPAPSPVPQRKALQGVNVSLIKGDYKQPRLEIAFQAPVLEHADTPSLDLAAFALGAGDASRFNRTLRDRDGVVTAAGASLYSTHFGGVFELSALMNQDSFLAATKGIAHEVATIKYCQPVTENELARARANLKSERVYQEETVGGQAKALGFGMTTSHKVLYDEVYATLLQHTTPSQVQEALSRWLKDEQVLIVGLLPEDSPITEDDIKTAFLDGWATAKKNASPKTRMLISKGKAEQLIKPERIELFPGVEVVYRQNLNSDMFNLIAASEGGLRAEDEKTAGSYYMMGELLGNATTRYSYEDMLALVEGAGAVIQGFSGKDSFGLKLQCLTEQMSSMMAIWGECFLRPRFPEEQFNKTIREIKETIQTETDSPFKIAARAVQERLFPNHPYRLPMYGTLASLANMNPEMLEHEFLGRRDGGPWVFGCVTNLPKETVITKLKEILGTWRPVAKRRDFSKIIDTLAPVKTETLKLQKNREQTHIIIGYRGLTWGAKERAALDVMGTILGGTGGRFFTKLRDEQSLAYSVSPIVSYGCNPGMVGAYIACSNDKADRALDALSAELTGLIAHPASEEELARAKNYLIGSHEADLQKGDAQAMTMALMQAYGIGFEDFLRYPEAVAKVTIADVTRIATQLLKDKPHVTVSVGPQEV